MNNLFPGRPDYVGPQSGMFALLHHEILCEPSDNVMERVDFVRQHKPPAEIATRLRHMMFLDAALCPAVAKRAPLYADYEAKRAPLDADYRAKRAALYADYEAKLAPLDADYEAKRAPLDAEILDYIKAHIPDCSWNEKELVF